MGKKIFYSVKPLRMKSAEKRTLNRTNATSRRRNAQRRDGHFDLGTIILIRQLARSLPRALLSDLPTDLEVLQVAYRYIVILKLLSEARKGKLG